MKITNGNSRPYVKQLPLLQETLPEENSPGSLRLVGIGTSNKSLESFLEELKKAGVKTVVDVRARPLSRYYPHFNEKRLSASLQTEGIRYEWLGKTLGNPANEQGERTLEGFQQYMKTNELYEKGITQLLEIFKQTSEGSVALICAEKQEQDCHRKFIIADLAKRLT